MYSRASDNLISFLLWRREGSGQICYRFLDDHIKLLVVKILAKTTVPLKPNSFLEEYALIKSPENRLSMNLT